MPVNKNDLERLLNQCNRDNQNAATDPFHYLSILAIDAEEYKSCTLDDKLKKIKNARNGWLIKIHPDKNQDTNCEKLANDCVIKIKEAYEELKKQCEANLKHPQPIEPANEQIQKAENLLREAHKNYSQGEYFNTISICSKALLLNPQLLEAYRLRGLTYLHKGELESADVDCNHLLALEPDNPNAFQLHGEIKKRRGDNEGAKKDFRHALEKKDLAECWKNTLTGAIAYLNNDFSEAHDLLSSVYNTVTRTDFFLLIYLGLSKQAMGEHQAAVAIFKDLIKWYPNMRYAYTLQEGALKKKQEREERDYINLAPLKNSVAINQEKGTVPKVLAGHQHYIIIILKELANNKNGLSTIQLLHGVPKEFIENKLAVLEELEKLGYLKIYDKDKNCRSSCVITENGIKLYTLISKKATQNIASEKEEVKKRSSEKDSSVMEKTKRMKSDQYPNTNFFASTTNAEIGPGFERPFDTNTIANKPLAGQKNQTAHQESIPLPAQSIKTPPPQQSYAEQTRIRNQKWAEERSRFLASFGRGIQKNESFEQMPKNKKS